MSNISTDQNLFIDITAECGQENSSVRLERLLMSPGMKSLRINDEFVGELFYTDGGNNKTVIFFGGSSNEDLRTILPPAALPASHGFNVLALAYFGSKGLNSTLAEIPLEYFENVFKWLEENPLTKCREIYVYSGSIGAILALLLASSYPFIKKVVACNPLAWSFQGLTFKKISLWTYGGKPIPFIIPVHEFSTPLKIAPRLVFSEEVTWEANAHMLEDSWNRALEFLKKQS
jgi:pimeloyl-ACP methyl ester carboxylesterase